MGNMFRKKKAANEELEEISKKVKEYRKEIDRTYESKRMLLWYLTLCSVFVSTSASAAIWYHFDEYQIPLTIVSFVAGVIFLFLSRKLLIAFYEWRLNRKKKELNVLFDTKKSIIEKVKETETFKIAKEILEKYGEEEIVTPLKTQSQPSSPLIPKRPPPIVNVAQTTPQRPVGPPRQGTPGNEAMSRPLAQPLGFPAMTPGMRPRAPVRPYQQQANGVVDKVVDYFFSDGPSNRMALICANCHGHNGMALPEEFDHIAYMCFICSHLNKARKGLKVWQPPATGRPFVMEKPSSSEEPLTSEKLSNVTGKNEAVDKVDKDKESSQESAEDDYVVLADEPKTSEEDS